MNASSLELLEKSELPPVQARAILQAMDTEMAIREFVTKTDLRNELRDLEHRLELKMESMKNSVLMWTFVFWVAQLGALAGIVKMLK